MRRITIILVGVLLLGALLPSLVAASQAAPSADQVVAAIDYWSDVYGVSRDWMVGVAQCESNLDQRAVGRQGEIGVFQWYPPERGPGLWEAMPEYALGQSVYDWQVNIEAGVHAHAMGYASSWSCG